MNEGFPCGYCGVRPDVACRHRPADETYKPPEPTKETKQKPNSGPMVQRYNARKIKGLPD